MLSPIAARSKTDATMEAGRGRQWIASFLVRLCLVLTPCRSRHVRGFPFRIAPLIRPHNGEVKSLERTFLMFNSHPKWRRLGKSNSRNH